MRVLVTGSEGFIGRHLVRALLGGGHTVIGVDDNSSSMHWDFVHDNYEPWKWDIKQPLIGITKTIDCIIHLAGRNGVGRSFNALSEFAGDNMLGTMRILELCKQIKCKRFLFASSSSVYGDHGIVLSPYAAMKDACERIIAIYCKCAGISFLNLRFFNVFGPGQPFRSGTVIPTWINGALTTKSITVNGDSDRIRRDFTYVEDVARGIIYAIYLMDIGLRKNTSIDIAQGIPISLTTVYQSIERIFACHLQVLRTQKRDGDVDYSCAEHSIAPDGFEFKESFFSGLVKTIESVRRGE